MPASDQQSQPFDPLALENVGVTLALELLEQPLHDLSPDAFTGAGVYALYYAGNLAAYAPLKLDSGASAGLQIPIYVGRASLECASGVLRAARNEK